ncbi:MAG: DUF58 domain-containing protein [Bauldia sp.]|nr:DUF58 domain-containing protein [Bauldia sp.]
MTTPPPALLQRLSRSKLQPRWAAASVGVGERRSKHKGAGMEFADHRKYEVGDDLRHLDPHIHARLGENFIRRYEVHRQLPIAILLDGSRSMATGQPSRAVTARLLVSLLGFVGLAGGDQVQLGVATSKGIDWSGNFHGVSRAQPMFDWLARERSEAASFGDALRTAPLHLVNRGLFIAISDWWDDTATGLVTLGASGQEIWGIHVVTPEELDPSMLGQGEARLVDAESGLEVDLSIDRPTLDRYRARFQAWREDLRQAFTRVRGRYLTVVTSTPPETLFLKEWRSEGLIQ